MQNIPVGREVLEEINRLRNSPGRFVSLVIGEYKSKQEEYDFNEFQIIVNQLEIQEPVAKLKWEDTLYAMAWDTLLHGVPPQEPPTWLAIKDFGTKSPLGHVIAMLLNGHLKKILSPDMQYGAVGIKESSQRALVLKMADHMGQRKTKEQLRLESMHEHNGNSFLQNVNHSIKTNLDNIETKQGEQNEFQLIGKAKKAMNEYLRFYYKDNNDTTQEHSQHFKVADTYQDKERQRTMQMVQRSLVDQKESFQDMGNLSLLEATQTRQRNNQAFKDRNKLKNTSQRNSRQNSQRNSRNTSQVMESRHRQMGESRVSTNSYTLRNTSNNKQNGHQDLRLVTIDDDGTDKRLRLGTVGENERYTIATPKDGHSLPAFSGSGGMTPPSWNNETSMLDRSANSGPNKSLYQGTSASMMRDGDKRRHQQEREQAWVTDDVLARDFDKSRVTATDYEQEFYVNEMEKKVQRQRANQAQLRATPLQQQQIGDRLTNQKTIVQQIREFQTMEDTGKSPRGLTNTTYNQNNTTYNNNNTTYNNNNTTTQNNNTTQPPPKYYDPDKDRLEFKEIEDLELDAELMSCFLVYFEDYFYKRKKVKLSFDSIDNLYIFMKTFFTDLNVPYRLYPKADKDKKERQYFEVINNFELFTNIVKNFLKMHSVAANYTQFNLTFCFNLLEHLLVYKKFTVRHFDRHRPTPLTHGQVESNFKLTGVFVKQLEAFYKDYADHKNYVEIESVYDLLHQTIMDGKFKVYLKDYHPQDPLPGEDVAEILDVQEDEALHQTLSDHIQEVFLTVHDTRTKQIKPSKVKFDQLEFNLQINDIIQIVTKLFSNKNFIIRQQTPEKEYKALQEQLRKEQSVLGDDPSQDDDIMKREREELERRQHRLQLELEIEQIRPKFIRKTAPPKKISEKDMEDSLKQDLVWGHRKPVKKENMVTSKDMHHKMQHEIINKKNMKKLDPNRKHKGYFKPSISAREQERQEKLRKEEEQRKKAQREEELKQEQILRRKQEEQEAKDKFNQNNKDTAKNNYQEQLRLMEEKRQRQYEEMERERQRQQELEWERQRQREIELDRQRELELERQRQRELELERERQRELELERERQQELQQQRDNQKDHKTWSASSLLGNTMDPSIFSEMMGNSDVLSIIMSFLGEEDKLQLKLTSWTNLKRVIQVERQRLETRYSVLVRMKTVLVIQEELMQEFKATNIRNGRTIQVYPMIEHVTSKVMRDLEITNEELYNDRISVDEVQLIQQEPILSKVLIITYILIEKFEFLKMDEETSEFYFTSSEYFTTHTLQQILQEFNSRSDISQQKVTLLELILDDENFQEIQDKDIVATAITPVYYFLHLYVQYFMAIIGVEPAQVFFHNNPWFHMDHQAHETKMVQENKAQQKQINDEQLPLTQQIQHLNRLASLYTTQ